MIVSQRKKMMMVFKEGDYTLKARLVSFCGSNELSKNSGLSNLTQTSIDVHGFVPG